VGEGRGWATTMVVMEECFGWWWDGWKFGFGGGGEGLRMGSDLRDGDGALTIRVGGCELW
jgi:hypothetical protein